MSPSDLDGEGAHPVSDDDTLSSRGTSLSRREFLTAGLAGTALLGFGGWIGLNKALAEAQAQYAMVIDLNKCVGCRACEFACTQRNNHPQGLSYISILPKEENGRRFFLPVQCQHCQQPPCKQVCPVKAIYTHPTGVVLHNENTCVGCKYCNLACPYGARRFNEETGLSTNCWLCLDWVLGGGTTACVQACILGARLFGRRDDPNSEVSKLIASGRARPLRPEFGTNPGILLYIQPGD